MAFAIYAALGVWRLKAFHVTLHRLPAIIADLNEQSGRVSNALGDFDASHETIQEAFARCSAILRNAEPKLHGEEKALVQELVDLIAAYRAGEQPGTREDARFIYNKLLEIEIALTYMQRELELR